MTGIERARQAMREEFPDSSFRFVASGSPSAIDHVLNAFLADLGKTHVVVPRELLAKLIERSDEGLSYWDSEFDSGSEKHAAYREGWEADNEKAHAFLKAASRSEASGNT